MSKIEIELKGRYSSPYKILGKTFNRVKNIYWIKYGKFKVSVQEGYKLKGIVNYITMYISLNKEINEEEWYKIIHEEYYDENKKYVNNG